ncbi:MAG: hypothetical protein OXL37_08175 [Chloroflexota bacterium]|nr:hypothetical protein [Chloroflexota bacterium]MDE2958636.1 hypothetical protein [Chloroflexota bacterium]
MSVLARVFEEAGLTTVAIALVREHAERVRPPRALWVPFYFGYTMGKPDDPKFQHQVLAAALATLDAETGPVLADYPEDAGPIGLPQASEVTASTNGDADKPVVSKPLDAAGEITALRGYYERWQEQRGRTAVGVTGIPQRRFRGIIRFLEAYAESDEADMDERPADVSVPQFVRYCADDLKAFCYEARMAQRPDASEADIHTWFWGETAVGALIDSITQRLNATGDAKLQATAYGLSR